MKIHPKYPGYKFDKKGNCYSEKRKIFLKPRLNGDGYPIFTINNRQVFIHRVLGELFLEKVNSKLTQINHKNGKKNDNRLTNLEWVTAKQNQIHSRKVLGNRCAIGEKSGSVKLTESQVLEIKEALKNYKRGDYTRLAEKYGVVIGTIYAIKDNRSWDYLPPTIHIKKPPKTPRKNYYVRKGRAKGEGNGNSKLNQEKVIKIKKLLNGGYKLTTIASRFSISRSSVGLIRSGKIWNHITYLGG